MAYFSYGTSYRQGVQNYNLSVSNPDQIFTNPEFSTSYEWGLKTSWLDNTLRVNAAVFHQKYDGQILDFPGIYYVTNTPGNQRVSLASPALLANADSVVNGAELQVTSMPTRGLIIDLSLAYANGNLVNALIPCNTLPNGQQVTPTTPISAFTAGPINYCNSTRSITRTPPFSGNLNVEYTRQFSMLEGYVRGIWQFNSAAPNANLNYGAPGYSIFNLYLGVRNPDKGWDVGLFAKNLLDDRTMTFNNTPATAPYAAFGSSGYGTGVVVQHPREIGVTARYAFGGG
jgi:iron complex outermembrane receptor protein